MGRCRLLAAWLAPLVAVAACVDTSGFASGGASTGGSPDASSDGSNDAATTVSDGAADADATPVAPGTHLFSRSFGGPEEEYLSKGSVDLSGNLLLAGSVGSTIDLGGGVLTSAGAPGAPEGGARMAHKVG
jgi:hypothetical protein